MRATFEVPELIRIFRAALVTLIPIAEEARIAWRGPHVYDPWEDIERALFNSIVASVVENAVPASPRPLPKYGLTYDNYGDLSFITDRAARCRGEHLALLQITSEREPFDTMSFVDLGTGFAPTGRTVSIPFAEGLPELATRTADALRYCQAIEYEE